MDGYKVKVTVTQVFTKREGKGERGAWDALDFMATNPDGVAKKYRLFKKGELYPMVTVGANLDAEVVDKVSTQIDGDGNAITDHNVVNFYENGQPLIKQKQGGGWRQEDPVLKKRGMSLAYAKDLVVADKIKLEDIYHWAEAFAMFLGINPPVPSPTSETLKPVASKPPVATQQPVAQAMADQLEIEKEMAKAELTKLATQQLVKATTVYNILVKLTEAKIVTWAQIAKEIIARGGHGQTATLMVQSLPGDKLADLLKWAETFKTPANTAEDLWK